MPQNEIEDLVDESINEEPPVSPIADRLDPSANVTSDLSDANSTPSTPTPTNGNPSPYQGGGPAMQIPPAIPLQGTREDFDHFDPEIHAVDDAGLPIENKDGSYQKKKGRKKGSKNTTQNPSAGGIPNADSEKIQKAHASAVVTVQAIFMVGSLIGGDEFRPIVDTEKGIDEPQLMTSAWTQYYLTTEMDSLPPWLGVAIVTSSFFVSRMGMPKTQSRLQAFWGWIKSWFSSEEKGE